MADVKPVTAKVEDKPFFQSVKRVGKSSTLFEIAELFRENFRTSARKINS